jgi:hypothetical protein
MKAASVAVKGEVNGFFINARLLHEIQKAGYKGSGLDERQRKAI